METEKKISPAVWVTQVSAVTALGSTLDATWQGLIKGETAIREVKRFPTTPYASRIAACIDGLNPGESGSRIESLIDNTLDALTGIPKDALLILATTKGPLDLLEEKGFRSATGTEPFLIPDLVESVSRKLGISTPGVNISAACASSTLALILGGMRIASEKADAVLVVCADLVTEFVFSGFSALQILSAHPCAPFDRKRKGLSLGEGAAAVLLMSPRRARSQGISPLAVLRGGGISGDAAHIVSPDRSGSGLARAVKQALSAAGIGPEGIAAINAHGTGTVQNDRMELAAFHSVFKDRPILIHSVKGALGHTLGAAGGIELAVSVKAFQEQKIPSTVGCTDPEPSGKGRIFSIPAPLPKGCILSTNSGFGGVNAAVIIESGETP